MCHCCHRPGDRQCVMVRVGTMLSIDTRTPQSLLVAFVGVLCTRIPSHHECPCTNRHWSSQHRFRYACSPARAILNMLTRVTVHCLQFETVFVCEMQSYKKKMFVVVLWSAGSTDSGEVKLKADDSEEDISNIDVSTWKNLRCSQQHLPVLPTPWNSVGQAS